MKRIKFTKAGFEDLKKEHAELSEKRKEAVTNLTTARDMGDRSENGAYKAARSKLSQVDRRMRYLENTIRWAEVVEAKNAEYADLGSTVVIDDGKNKLEFMIVGGHESDLAKKRLSMFSPIGKALMGKKAGDVVTVTIPVGKVIYTVVSIRV